MRWMRGIPGVGVVLLACSSGSEPLSEDAYFGTTGYIRDCRFATDSLDEREVTPFGVSPADVVAWLEGDHRLSIEYNPDGLELLGLEPGTSEVSIDIQSLGRAGWVHYALSTPSGREVYCHDSLIVDAHLRLSTADGALDHEMDLSFLLEEAELAVARVLIGTDALRGASREPPVAPEGGIPELWLALTLELTPSESSGNIVYYPASALRLETVATFPSTVCPRGYEPSADATYAALRAQAVAGLNVVSPVTLQSSAASLELAFEDHREPGCVLPSDTGDTSLEFAGDAVLRSSDGAIDGRTEVLIDADFDGDELFAARATRSLFQFDAAEEVATQAASIITEPLDFSPYTGYGLEFLHGVTAAGDYEGELRAYGAVTGVCAVGGSPESCTRNVVLFGARWGNAVAP